MGKARFDIRVFLVFLSVAVPAAGMTVLWCLLPAHADDLWYDQGVRDFMSRGQTRWQAVLSEMHVHAMTDNLRLANVAYLLGGWLPRVVTACFLGLCMAWGLWRLTRLSGGGVRTPLRASFLSVAYVCLMPWMAYPFSHDFALNYVPSVALCSWTAWMFCRPAPTGLRGRVWTGALALLTGFWHEGAAVPLIVAFPVYMLVSGNRERWRWLVWLALMPGVLAYVCLPGFWYRLSQMGTGHEGVSLKWAYLLTVGLAAVALWLSRRARRRDVPRPDVEVIGLCASGGVGSLALALVVSGCERAMVCGMMLCLAGWVRVAGLWRGRFPVMWIHRASVWTSVMAVCVLAGHFAVVVEESRAMLVKYDAALARYVDSGRPWVSCDLDYGREWPCLWRECRPAHQFLRPGYVQQRLSIWWRGEDRFQIFYDEEENVSGK